MAVALADKRGMKRICTSCGTRFYDMNNRPIVCPNCSVEFTGETKVKTRRGRSAVSEDEGRVAKATASKVKEVGAGDDEDELVADDMVVSLEDVEELDDADEDDELGDLGLDEDGDLEDLEDLDDDTSLEDELEAEGPDGAVEDEDVK